MASTRVSTPAKPATVIDWLKPRRAEAIARLRNNGFAALVVLIIAQLLPVFPSPLACATLLMSGGSDMGSGTKVACWLELAALGVLGLNILQASYALQYPPPLYSPLDSPAKRAQLVSPAPRRLKPLSPQSPMQNQTSQPSLYAPSPFSTPSRTMTYKGPSPSPSTPPYGNSFSSSFSSLSSPPLMMSSPLASYRGRHAQSVGRPVDGNLLSRLQAADDDD